MLVQLTLADFKPSDTISVLSFLYDFKTPWDNNGIIEGVALWLIQHFMKDWGKVAIANRNGAMEKVVTRWKRKLETYYQVASYLFASYATEDATPEAESDVTYFRQPEWIFAVCYSELLWAETLRFGRV